LVGFRLQTHRNVPVTRLAGLVLVLVWLMVPGRAQAALGDGLLVGNARLHLGAELLLKFDSQAGAGVYQGYGAFDQLNPPDGVGVVRGTVGLDGKGENYRLNFASSFDWNQYAGIVANTRALSFFGANAAGSVIVNQNAPVGFELMGTFLRSDRTTNPLFGLGVLSLGGNLQARVKLRPWKGRFEFGFGGDLGGNWYTPQVTDKGSNYGLCNGVATCDPGLAAAYNAVTYKAVFEAKWRLFPKTGFTLDASFGARDYQYGKGTSSYALVPNTNALPYSGMLGFGSLLSTRLSFVIKAGYLGITFPDNVKRNIGGPVALAELGFRFSERSSGRVGYTRIVEPVGGNELWYGDHRAYVDVSLQPMQHLLLYGIASLDLIGYGTTYRTDTAYSLNLRGEYHLRQWLKLLASAGLSSRRTNSNSAAQVEAGTQAQAFSYNRADISLGVATLF
jgi:hypothetical protein